MFMLHEAQGCVGLVPFAMGGKMPDQPKPDLTAYIGMIKHEISEHCMKLMERMDSCYEIEKKEITEHADKEIERIKQSLIESIDQLLKEPKE